MRWYKGLLFVLVAVISLGAVLFWPHPKSDTSFTSIGSSRHSEITPRGIPFVWLKINEGEAWGTATGNEQPTKFVDRSVIVPKLLINLIFWGVLMLGVELLLRGYYKKRTL